ncbi:hypothetical protein O181_026146, partial [Austropuccinia psidii MF-1]|nr:hypothetical protein [Austropuccinia psidii MF-1]
APATNKPIHNPIPTYRAPLPMDLDAVSTANINPQQYFRRLCQIKGLCFNCLDILDNKHRPAPNRHCPNPPATFAAKAAFMRSQNTNHSQRPPSTQISAINVPPHQPPLKYCKQKQKVVQFFITCMNGTIARGTALIDTGAASSFVNEDFIHQHQLLKKPCPSPVKIQAFDGSSGQSVTHLWVGNFTLQSNDGKFATSAVRANITKIAKVDLILGMPWFQASNAWVGGWNAAMQFQGLLFSGIKLVSTGSLSNEEKLQLQTYIDDLLKKGFIQVSSSPAAASIFFVKSKGKANQPCVDYRALNAMTIRDSYPLPHLNMIVPLTAFRTPWGLFEYLVMPFGLANAPATFQRFIQHVLREYIDVFCYVYLDDILIFSKTSDEHYSHIASILSKLHEHHLVASLSKCEFFKYGIIFLGFKFSMQGIGMDPAKLKTITDWPYPTDLKSLRCFLGFCNFYQRFIRDYSGVVVPLTSLTKDGADVKSGLADERAMSAFKQLLSCFTKAQLLLHFDFTKPRVIQVDASCTAMAAILSQPDENNRLRPVCYFSCKLSPAEASWQVHDQELGTIIEAFKEWRAWLIGAKLPITVFSDHANLRYSLISSDAMGFFLV